jgi:hypothetical protein
MMLLNSWNLITLLKVITFQVKKSLCNTWTSKKIKKRKIYIIRIVILLVVLELDSVILLGERNKCKMDIVIEIFSLSWLLTS